MKLFYKCINALFHTLHMVFIVFVMVGWLFPEFRTAHLIMVFLTLGSWFIVGQWLGIGYCPITDWHWKIKDAVGEGRPKESYIHTVLKTATGRNLNSTLVDNVVLIGTILVAVLSLLIFLST